MEKVPANDGKLKMGKEKKQPRQQQQTNKRAKEAHS